MLRAPHFAFSLILLGAVCAAAPPPTPSGFIGVFLDFDSLPGAASVDVMQKEVEKLIRPSGLLLGWRRIRENRGDEAFSGLVVLRFKGSCRADPSPDARNDFGTLGEIHALASTAVVRGRVTPFGEVQCDQIRQALSYLNPGANRGERQRALGVALARVVAHELYHMLAQTTHHAQIGLAKAAQSLADLVSPRELAFQESEEREMREGWRGAALKR